MKPTLIVLTPLLLAPVAALHAADFSIENEVLAVRYTEAAKTFSILHKPTQRVFAKNATFAQPIEHAWLAVAGGGPHPVFGQGKAMEFDHADGSVSRIELFPKLEFAVVSGILRNSTKEPRIVDKVTLLAAELNVGRPPNDLRVSGSRGNVAAPGNEADVSHAVAALAEPQSRRGAVGGWLTHDRGAGIVMTPLTPDKKAAMMKARIDYGAWLIPPGEDGTTETFVLGWFEDARLGLEAYADAVAKVCHIRLPADEDITVTLRVRLNHQERADGHLERTFATKAARQSLRRNDLTWRKRPDLGASMLLLETFHCGSELCWAPRRPCAAELGHICLTPTP